MTTTAQSPVWSSGPFYDLNGAPLANGLLWTFQGSSWTALQPTYQSSGAPSGKGASYSVLAGNGDSTYTPPGRYNGYATAAANTAYAGVTGDGQAYGSYSTLSNPSSWANPAMLIVDEDAGAAHQGGPVLLWSTGSTPSWDHVVITSDSGPTTFYASDANFITDGGYSGWLFFTGALEWTVGNTYNLTFYTAGAQPNTNPIVLDSAGNLPAGLYLIEDVLYNLLLQDAQGNLISRQANINVSAITDPVVRLSPAWNGITFLDNNGLVAAGGSVYVWTDDSRTIMAESWADDLGTIPNPNPITLNDGGRMENGFYLADGQGPFFSLYGVDGNFIRNYPSAPPNPWAGPQYTYNGTGNSNGSSFQSIVSDDAGVYAYVSGFGVGQPASSSDGGNTWAPNSSAPGSISQIYFNGTYFIALIGYGGDVYYTADLQTWVLIGSYPNIYQLYQDTGTGAVYFSPYPTSPNTNLYRIAPNANTVTQVITNAPGPNLATYGTGILTVGGVTVSAYSAYPTYTAWYSTDEGVTWTESPTTIGQYFYGLTNNGTTWMFVTSQTVSPYAAEVWTSTDGIHWANVFTGSNGPPYENEISAFNGLFLSFQGSNLATSSDGITWTNRTVGSLLDIFGVTAGSRLYVYGPEGLYESTNGTTFTATSLTLYTNDVESTPGATLAIACTYGQAPDFVYKRNPT